MFRRQDHWGQHALQWSRIGPPLRPAPQDIGFLQEVVADWALRAKNVETRALLLGVTPEVIDMAWPRPTRLVAVDRSLPMIRHVWSLHSHNEAQAVCADWRSMPLPDRSCHIAIGDGCLSLLDFPNGYHAALNSIRHVLDPEGLFVMRFFVRPSTAENPAQVFKDLEAGRIGNFHVFKWRLAMALHPDTGQGVRLGDIWDAWNAAVPAPEKLAAKLGWPLGSIATIQVYRGVDTRYTFPTLEEVRDIVGTYFAEQTCHFPTYELGDRCPTLSFRPLH